MADENSQISTGGGRVQARMEAAVARLEAAAGARREIAAGGSGKDALAKELDSAKGRLAELDSVNQDVTRRLDSAIGRIKALLKD